MIERGDLVRFDPDDETERCIENFVVFHRLKSLRKRVSCGCVVRRQYSEKEKCYMVAVLFPEGYFVLSEETFTPINKGYVSNL